MESSKQYFADIARYPLLTKSEEFELGQRIRRAKILAIKIKRKQKVSPDFIPKQKHIDILNDGEAAKTKFINCNLRLVISIARRYANNSNLHLIDIVQYGNEGLLKAVDKFDASKGFKFSTYATWWIRQSIERGMSSDTPIKIPTSSKTDFKKIIAHSSAIEKNQNKIPSIKEISDDLNMPYQKVHSAFILQQGILSIDSSDHSVTLSDILETDQNNIAQAITKITHSDFIERILSNLEIKEKQIITLRYGLFNSKPHSIDEIAELLKLEPNKVRNIETRSLQKMKKRIVKLQEAGYISEELFHNIEF